MFGDSTTSAMGKDVVTFFFTAGSFGIYINIILLVLNLIPIPPLDGSRLVASLLPPTAARSYERIEPYGIWILLALLVFGLLGRILSLPVFYLAQVIKSVFGL